VVRRLLPLLLVCSLAAPLGAEEGPTAADVTERGRSLDRILDIVLLPEGRPIEGARTLLLLVDPTASLKAAGLPAALGAALERNAAALGGTRVGVLTVGAAKGPALAPTRDRAAVVAAVEALLADAADTFRNVYADVRAAVQQLRRESGRRDLLLVTLENGDVEDDVEATAAALARADVRLSVVAREAFLADTWLLERPQEAPRDLEPAGGDAAWVDLPWGYLFQQTVANSAVLSGFAMYGLTRLAAASGGHVFPWYPPSATPHQCVIYGTCPFCTGDHVPPGAAYRPERLQALAPSALARDEAFGRAARDPAVRLVLRTWDRMSKEGLVRSRPSVRLAGSSLRPEKRPLGRWETLGSSLAFASQAGRADRLTAECEAILQDLEQGLEGLAGGGADARAVAVAEATRVLLHVTRYNLRAFAAFCRTVGPELERQDAGDLAPPEVPRYGDDLLPIGIGYTSMGLCHGAAPYRELRLPGGAEMDAALDALVPVVDGFLARYRHTPFADVVRRSGLALFHFTVRGRVVPPPPRKVPGSPTESTSTPSSRPPRQGGGSSGGGSGPTTGGG
jgi:hypothetical protein